MEAEVFSGGGDAGWEAGVDGGGEEGVGGVAEGGVCIGGE